MATYVGAEEPAPAEATAQESTTTTTQEPTTTTQAPTTTQPTTAAVQSLGLTIGPLGHTNPPQFEECKPTGSVNPWESDERADPSGDCTDGNIGQGNDAAVLAQCTGVFGSSVTNFYNSGTAAGTGNEDVSGVISDHSPAGTQVNVTPDPGVVIDGVFVKAGGGYNAYIGNETNMIGPMVGNWDSNDNQPSPNFADISHYVVCYHFSEVLEETGGLDVTKSIVGDAPANTTFTVNIDCETDDTGDGTLVFDEDGTLTNAGTIDSLPITGLPVGTSCTITEPDNGGADSVNITGSPAVITADTNQEVDVENTFQEEEPDTGGLDVTKSIVGDAPANTTFTVNIDCETDDTGDGTLVFDEDGTLTNAGTIDSLPITGLPVGTSCTITEPDNGGADSVNITGSPAVITADTNQDVDVENTFIEVGGDFTVRLDVDKQVVGSVAPAIGTQFVVHVSCTGDATVEEDLTFTYPNGLGVQSITEQIPSLGDLTCTVTETDPGGVILQGYKIDGGALQQGAPTIVLDLNRTNAGVTVVNDPSKGTEVGGSSVTVLPFTGSTTEILLKSAVWLLIIGAVAWLVTRRRRVTMLG
ncbi:MAG: DUF5979 domain-containing protein [Acidimicrobiia bacterium]